ncbi:hypothetical protein GDO78_007619 [Eleutherodactylus coqui]|uniref:Uncharacterized protein n=1 Tax=Eleutherodactylus coqui TaxID=57060 RepID=A0A8J6FH58_ELECQ|nr:hypothetical protein GDO78_007619 [Eleutherodactylus coqui]
MPFIQYVFFCLSYMPIMNISSLLTPRSWAGSTADSKQCMGKPYSSHMLCYHIHIQPPTSLPDILHCILQSSSAGHCITKGRLDIILCTEQGLALRRVYWAGMNKCRG